MLPLEISKLQSSEFTRNVYFSIYLCIFNVFKGASKLHEKGHFARDIEMWGARAPCAPPVPESIASNILVQAITVLSMYSPDL